MKSLLASVVIWVAVVNASAQSPRWSLWAKGLPGGAYPRMTVAPNHDIFYTLLGTGIQPGIIFRANTLQSAGEFSPLPQIPRPPSIQNNIVALGCNHQNEPVAGIYRTDMAHPWIFRLDNSTGAWDTSKAELDPTLGAHTIATAKNGVMYMGVRWANIYKSTDGGRTFRVINDTKSVASAYPCYYPTWNGSEYGAAIFSVAVDGNGRVYAGTETAGVIYSDDEGESWHPADLFACKKQFPNEKDSASPMKPLSMSGNAAALGFTRDNNLVWSGADMWTLNWKNKLGYADMKAGTTRQAEGLPDYLVQTGQQISKIVTTANGRMFLHSGSSNGATQIGVYTSSDGIRWQLFNDGITGANTGLAQNGLAVDGNIVFFATADGQIWKYDAGEASSAEEIAPNEAKTTILFADGDEFTLKTAAGCGSDGFSLSDAIGRRVAPELYTVDVQPDNAVTIRLFNLPHGVYFLSAQCENSSQSVVICWW